MWREPKTDWIYTDYFNVNPDYIRIKENIEFLAAIVSYTPDLEEVTIATVPSASFFVKVNIAVNDLYIIVFDKELNLPVRYPLNEPTWTFETLNIIENALLQVYTQCKYAKKIPLTLGGVQY